MTRAEETHLEYADIKVGADGVAELEGRRCHIWIPRQQIARLETSFGSAAERPLITLILGILLVTLSLLGPALFIGRLLGYGLAPSRFAATIAFIVPAVWLLDLSLRRRAFLTVHLVRGRRKLLFAKETDPAAAERFIVSAKSRFGYS